MLGSDGAHADPGDDAGVDAAGDGDDGAATAELANRRRSPGRELLDAGVGVEALQGPVAALLMARSLGRFSPHGGHSSARAGGSSRGDGPASGEPPGVPARPGWARRRTLEDPWHDDEIPSLVAIEDGEVVGFIRSQVRPMSFDGSPIRGVCLSDLVVSPEHRRGAAGAMLLGRLL